MFWLLALIAVAPADLRLLDRATFGARPADVDAFAKAGRLDWLDAELHPGLSDVGLGDRLASFSLLDLSTADLLAHYPRPADALRKMKKRGEVPPELGDDPEKKEVADWLHQHGFGLPREIEQAMRAQKILRGVYSDHQLQEVMVDFWFNHFNVSADKGLVRYYVVAYERDAIRAHALGKFSELLRAVAESPAMLFYLDNASNVASPEHRSKMKRLSLPPGTEAWACHPPNFGSDEPASLPAKMTKIGAGKKQTGINENYARELLELHTLGVDGGYTQHDVQEVARAFTGWTIFDPDGNRGCPSSGSFFFDAASHDNADKQVLGHTLAGGRGVEDGLEVLDLLARSPVTARFIATKLVRHFVADAPPSKLVDAVTAVYLKSDGDIAAVLRAIFNSPEFASEAAVKTKRPFELVVSALRAMNADSDATAPMQNWLSRLGEPLYQCQPPTGYADVAAPWVNQGALLERLNFSLALAGNRIKGTHVDLAPLVGEATVSGGGFDQPLVVERLVSSLLRGQVGERTRRVLLQPLDPAPLAAPQAMGPEDDTLDRNLNAARLERKNRGRSAPAPQVATLCALVLGAPEFQRQ